MEYKQIAIGINDINNINNIDILNDIFINSYISVGHVSSNYMNNLIVNTKINDLRQISIRLFSHLFFYNKKYYINKKNKTHNFIIVNNKIVNNDTNVFKISSFHNNIQSVIQNNNTYIEPKPSFGVIGNIYLYTTDNNDNTKTLTISSFYNDTYMEINPNVSFGIIGNIYI
jgi:hypothetical protein